MSIVNKSDVDADILQLIETGELNKNIVNVRRDRKSTRLNSSH